jgi:hypothetical protein
MAAVRNVAFNQGKNIKSGVKHKIRIAMKKLRQVYAEKRWILINEPAKTEAVLFVGYQSICHHHLQRMR